MAWIETISRLLPRRPPLRTMLNALVIGYLFVLSMQAINSAAQPASDEAANGSSLALFGAQHEPAATVTPGRIPVAVPDGLQQLKQTFKILGIICRDDVDRSVFVRDLSTGDERIYRVGDSLNGSTLTEIHSSYVVMRRGSTRMLLDINSRERDRLVTEDEGES